MVHRGDDATVLVVEESERVVVGRATDADLHLDDGKVSRRHTEIGLRDGQLYVRDLGGRNGTKVAGTLVRNEERSLGRGQEVRIGKVRLVVVSVPAPRAAVAPGEDIVVEDPKTKEVVALARRLSEVPTTVLLHGETGVGKEVVAELIHRRSARSTAAFVALSCAAVPATLLESELFGHEKGAFTGATATKRGYLETADGGTLFLDEIGELSPEVQVKLLRVLETRRVQRVGGREEIAIDVRVICATHRDLEAMAQRGQFREDLYYRVAGFVLEIPPLRERRADIAPLVDRFLTDFAAQTGMPRPEISERAMSKLMGHGWPGNVRELRNAVEHAVVLAGGATIEPEHLPRTVNGASTMPGAPAAGATMKEAVEHAERRAIEEALRAADGHRGKAAELLGVSKRTLQYKLAKHGFHE